MTAILQVEKQQFQNNTGGWVGVVIIGPKGDDRGANVEPDGTIWLSEAEQRLTANAPRAAKDNPFIPQLRQRRSEETGEIEDYEVTPLTPCSEERWVPADARPIPATTPDNAATRQAQFAARGEEPTVVTTGGDPVAKREAEVEEMGDGARPGFVPVPPRRAADAAAAAQAAQAPDTATPTEDTSVSSNAPETPASAPEETASTTPPVPDETGAAVPPQAPAPEGEYAAGEEVGTPVQTSPPTTSTETPTTEQPGESPAPWQG